MPAKKPRKVLWEPNKGLLSTKFLPKSMDLPPPKITGAPLAQYAGKMNHNAAAISISIIVISVIPYPLFKKITLVSVIGYSGAFYLHVNISSSFDSRMLFSKDFYDPSLPRLAHI